jgi:phosphoglycolate phosphatase
MTLIIFDCDGTLVDSQHIIVTAMERAFAAHQLEPLERQRVLSIVGLSLPVAISQLLPEADPGLVLRVTEAYRDAFHDLRRDPAHNEPMFPGALEAIETLGGHADVVLGLATGKSRRGVDAILERFDLTSRFVTIQTADHHPSKPHPSMILKAIAEVGADPAETIMIGDTTFDIEMARAAEVGAIGVAWGYHPVVALERAGAHVIVERCSDIVTAIRDRLARAGSDGADARERA